MVAFNDTDPNDINTTLRLLHVPGTVTEVIALDVFDPARDKKHGTIAGMYDTAHLAELVKLAVWLSQRVITPATYLTVNPLRAEMLAVLNNRHEFWVKRDRVAKDDDVIGYRRILIDLDVKRRTGTSSTDAEHNAAIRRAYEINEYLAAHRFPKPLIADSGNGAHLVLGVDEPNTPEVARVVGDFLKALARRFNPQSIDGVTIEVDTSTFNPVRLTKCYGTAVRKGDHTAERPHRRSAILDAPDQLEPCSLEMLQAVIDENPTPQERTSTGAGAAAANGCSATARAVEPSKDEVRQALSFINSDDRDTWFRIGCALKSHFGEASRELWDSWSQKSVKFDPSTQTSTWDRIHADGDITIATLLKLAQDAGWKRPRKKAKPPRAAKAVEPDADSEGADPAVGVVFQLHSSVVVPKFSEEELALDFIGKYRDHLRHVAELSEWLFWVEVRWLPDRTLQVYSLARKTCREFAESALQDKRTEKVGKSLASAKSRANLVSLATNDQNIAMLAEQFDRALDLAGTPGGVLIFNQPEELPLAPGAQETHVE